MGQGRRSRREGLDDLAEVRHLDYRDVIETGFDAVSSIGLTEHIGVRNYPAYFGFLRDQLRPAGRLLNHCITRPHNRRHGDRRVHRPLRLPRRRADRLRHGSSPRSQDAGLEVQHEENLRVHYAADAAPAGAATSSSNWDECVAEVGEGTARVWGLYMAGSRLGFERNEIQLHQVLATADRRRRPRRLPAAPHVVSHR